MFKYFFGCPKERLVSKGKLIVDALGEAGVALRDCLLDQSQCMVSDIQATSELGAGTVIDPFPGDRSNPQAVFGVNKENHAGWKWIAFESGLFKPDGERVQALIGYDPSVVIEPSKLRRHRLIAGKDIFAQQGSAEAGWMIPIARSPAMTYGQLATRWVPQPGGRMRRKLEQEDQWLWDLSGEVQDYLLWVAKGDELHPEWDDPWSMETSLQVLAVNYRIGRPEIQVLDAMNCNPLSDYFAIHALHAFVGGMHWATWANELQKKTNPATSPAPKDSKSGSGERVDAPGDLAAVS